MVLSSLVLRFEECSQIQTEVQELMEKQQWDEALQQCDQARKLYQELRKDTQLMYVYH